MARKDLKALENMNRQEQFATEIYGFHAQQAIEKSLKSLLSFLRVKYPKTHDLEILFY
jgi:HEPN domain-containing protein